MLENKVMKGGGVYNSLQKGIKLEQEKWRHVLKIILDVLLYCANNNQALRGNSEEIGNPAAGHFLNLISLISKSDEVLKQLIESHKKGSVSFFPITFKMNLFLYYLKRSENKSNQVCKIFYYYYYV